jgi:cellulose synthase/poly-beta-1,6-N-acetylglucosamine synthase-like glycosyltransferase
VGVARARVYLNVRAEPKSTIASVLAKILFWSSLGALAWTQAGYPLAAAALARLRGRPVRKEEIEPAVTLIVAAHDEEAVIERRLANLLALDYPSDSLEIVVASDASSDRTDELVEAVAAREPQVHLLPCPRGGKVAAQNRAVRASTGEILAFSDANAQWKPDALRNLVRNFADPDVAYVCGGHFYEAADGTNREGTYWRFEAWLRRSESSLGSITGGIGPIYAVRREDYVEVDPRFGHDLALPYLMVQHGRRAVFDPEAVAWEKPSRDIEDEYRRKVRMFEHCWLIVLRGRMLRRLGPTYLLEILSHRHLRYGSGLLHLVLLGSSIALVGDGLVYQLVLGAQIAVLVAALAGVGIARYYVLVTWATVASLVNYLRTGVPPVWEKAEGTR